MDRYPEITESFVRKLHGLDGEIVPARNMFVRADDCARLEMEIIRLRAENFHLRVGSPVGETRSLILDLP